MACGRDTLAKLLGGVRKFETDVYPENAELFESLANSQSPSTLFITCADSRISPSLVTQTEPGELFIVRNVGNIVPAYGEMLGGVSSAIEYAVAVLKVKNVVICGHSNCGAMSALMDLNSPKLANLPTVRSWMRNAEAARAAFSNLKAEDAGPADIRSLAEANVLLQLAHLRTHPAVVSALAQNQLNIQGWFYDIPKGEIFVLDETTRKTHTVDEALSKLSEGQEAVA
ncbi:carbonic anhydrase [Gluconobacter wancherniae]|uniref:Carbonic anhydrase n=1 Tax=Gluconobacter wancherniae NBRC 103581 TaxID=656744 RepID=A0A511AWS2_9PROT|nr:carbonic anhydrase [Gluconobacter wancherniae]MBF0852850.1 carbonic anhydrase [Gluconobacter wancherniae]MBS1061805.1 carbonic anhydrase [Gluconobacter wancherniae]MBS1087737.1 carbonic anhydrase [Gluconobacter wancherniae]MBS1093419.1 carbonic anhydrase [Gluconobacter wancherniae]GBD56435.1 carbonic anhydrase [Gluconobacter wancherniae NBRC 103581]